MKNPITAIIAQALKRACEAARRVGRRRRALGNAEGSSVTKQATQPTPASRVSRSSTVLFASGFVVLLLISVLTQGISGSTVVHAAVSALGGGLSGALTALVLVALRALLDKNGWKILAGLVAVGVVAAVVTGAPALQLAMPAASGSLGYGAGLVLVLRYFVRFTPRTALPSVFGTARWATRTDLDAAGLLAPAPTGAHLEGSYTRPTASLHEGATHNTGLFLGQEPGTGEAIVYDGDMHAVTIAPTRTGKDQTAILPNLVRSRGSMLVIDPKGESTRRTLARRIELGGKACVLDPWGITFSNPSSSDSNAGCRPPTQPARAAHDGTFDIEDHIARFNPLDRLKADDPDLAGDVMVYADALVMHEGSDPHWPNEAKALIAGFIAYIVTDPLEAQRRHLGRLRDILCLPLVAEQPGEALQANTLNASDWVGGRQSGNLNEVLARMTQSNVSFVRNSAFRFLQKEDRERASVMSTAHANTHFLESPKIRESLSKSDFSFADLKGIQAMTIYLAVPLDRLSAFGRWLRLLVSTALIELTRADFVSELPAAVPNAGRRRPTRPAARPMGSPHSSKPQPVRFILNEFAALGRLDAVETAFGTMAGLGVQLWVITQDLSQLKRLYGAENWQSFVANAGVFQYFGSRDYETAKYAEHLCGLATLKKRSVSFGTNWSRGRSGSSSGGGWSASSGGSESVTMDDVQRPLIFADELMRLPRDQQLLLIENLPPVMAKKWWWYRHQAVGDGGM